MRWHLGWIGVLVFVIAMTLTSGVVGGAIVGGCARLRSAEGNAMAREEGRDGDPAARDAAMDRMGTAGLVSTGLLTLLTLLVLLRVPSRYAGLAALPAAAVAGACNAVLLMFVMSSWPGDFG